MKNLVLLFSLLILGAIPIYALNQATFGGTVSQVKEVSVQNANANLDLNNAETGVKIFDLSGSNNSITGFKLTFASSGTGQLRSSVYDGNKAGTFLDYTIDIHETVPPGTARTDEQMNGIDLGQGDYNVLYDLSINTATLGAVWDVNINHPKKALFTGTYADTISVTIANL
jgi:hypothetical protein